ncbi:hypothetical protein AJ79_02473 [Helicocarpus griseus UAMH5409]|uniref:Calponin-homology (CH) domain-containing protein n=1 Tax=Helicocarpus griseus UAMH5409 TaxID=1447875 RepID=A0A2B7Y395_9EURO|nr:hypothetical protein AJ79_02473 [Helicocarpus griseus UAMH5409]
MASVTSLDKDLRSLRLSRYTPEAANEIRAWIEEVLRERLPKGDLLELLKSGVILCRLVNLAVSPGVKYRDSSMPFVQMENISHFLRACQMPPINLQQHDVFLTVDLYESKDPAQVLQCLRAFSNRANALQPGRFPRAIGVKSRGDAMSPQLTGSSQGASLGPPSYIRRRGASNASESTSTYNPMGKTSTSGQDSPAKTHSGPASPKPAISAWSNREEESTTIPAWNIHQYGYMGGANQGNLGISFGSRRQITSPSPHVPSLAEKERKRREKEAEEEKLRLQREDEDRRRRAELKAEEERARIEEERMWQEETFRLREKERREAEEEKKRWAEEQRRWDEEERRRNLEEKEAEERLEKERLRKKELSDARLNGQFLSQYQASQARTPTSPSNESERIKELERQLELAKERERQYEREREELAQSRLAHEGLNPEKNRSRSRSRSRPPPTPAKPSFDASSMEQERKLLRSEWQSFHGDTPSNEPTPPSLPPRSLPQPPAKPPRNTNLSPSSRPLPDPANYVNQSRTDRFLSKNPAPEPARPTSHRPPEFSTTSEVDEENARRIASTQKTKAGGWASKSLLEREMERERERQREWEENQKQTKEAAKRGVNTAGTAPGEGAWDVNQYGFMGGDNQNRGGPGLFSGARRQIIGPRPPP